MKYVYTIILTTSILIGTVFTGCQDIDLRPKDDLEDELFWKSPSDFVKALNYLYDESETFTDTGNKPKDIDSDISFTLEPYEISNGTNSAPNAGGDWNYRYDNIRQCNRIIEKSETYEGDFAAIERYVAEARFFRAYSYWRLMRKFSDVPIITKVLNINSPELYGKRDPQAKVEDFILSELEEIYAKLPKRTDLKSDELGRVTAGAALALKARVALFAGTWAKYHQHRTDYVQLLDQAIVASELVRSSGQYELFEGKGDESYRYLFIDEGDNTKEAIFDSRYDADIRMHSTAASVSWGWRGTPTKKLADMYLCKSTGLPIEKVGSGFQGYETIEDEYKDRDPRMNQTILMPGTAYRNVSTGDAVCNAKFTHRPETRTGYKLWKFMGEAFGRGTNESTFDYHIIRYPEVLLILAEATFEKDGAISNDLLGKTINVIRGRKGVEMPALTNEFVTTNGLDMRTEIRRERTIELAFEGFRRDDLRRWKTAEIELKQAIRGIKYKGTEYEEQGVLNDGNPGLVDVDGFLIVEPATNRFFTAPKHYYFPLPLDEILLNQNLLPNNPGW